MPAENDLSAFEKFFAGFLLILFTLGSLVLLYGYWPDRLPEKNDTCQNYCKKLFAVRLIDSCSGTKANKKPTIDSLALLFTKKDTTKADTARIDSLRKLAAAAKQSRSEVVCTSDETITLNQLLILLVALGGFLGNMIFITSAFTAYVGAGTFKRSWILWYFAKPFMASGLALAFYFVFRAGFLNYSNDTSNLNIYGIMSLAILTGLFTKVALQKLGDVFGFRQDVDGKAKPGPNDVTVTSIEPDTIDKTAPNTITIKGQHFDKQAPTVSINGVAVVNPDIKPDTITIKYTVPPDQQQATTFTVVVADSKGKALKSRDMTAKP